MTRFRLLAAEKFWILDPLYAALGSLLAWFYAFIPSYGVAIMLLTIAVRLATFPLTAKQTRSQQAMQRLQPELKRLQAKYKNDRQKLNEEMLKFYRENKVNPLGGCLPVLLQFPVLIVLYRLILGLSRTAVVGFMAVGATGTGPLAGVTVEGGKVASPTMEKGIVVEGTLEDARAEVDGKVVGTIADTRVTNGKVAAAQVLDGNVTVGTITGMEIRGGRVVGSPQHVPSNSDLYRALQDSAGDLSWLGMNLADSPAAATGGRFPYFVLIGIVVATAFFQQRQITSRMPTDAASAQMQAITRILPIFFGFISFTIPAGVVVYFATSNLWQIGQQAFMFRNQPAPTPPDKKSGSAKTSGGGSKKSGPAGKPKAPSTGKGGPKGTSPAKGRGPKSSSGKGGQQQANRDGSGGRNQKGKNPRGRNPGRNQSQKNPGTKKRPQEGQ